jgi:hypothetical protein
VLREIFEAYWRPFSLPWSVIFYFEPLGTVCMTGCRSAATTSGDWAGPSLWLRLPLLASGDVMRPVLCLERGRYTAHPFILRKIYLCNPAKRRWFHVERVTVPKFGLLDVRCST